MIQENSDWSEFLLFALWVRFLGFFRPFLKKGHKAILMIMNLE